MAMNTRMNTKKCSKITALTMLILFMAASTGLAYDTVLLRAGSLLNSQAVGVLDTTPVFFADAELKDGVRSELFREIGRWISDPNVLDMLQLTELAVEDNDVYELTGLETAVNMRFLGLEDNYISQITALAPLLQLEDIDLSGNLISDISPLAQMTNLTSLDLQENPLNIAAYSIYLPQIEANNPGINLLYDSPDDWNAADYVAAGREFLFDRTLTGIRNAYLIFDFGISQVGTGDRDLVFLHALTRAMMLVVEDGQTGITSLFELAAEYGINVVGDSLEDPGLDAKPVLNAGGHYEIPAGARDEDEIRDLLDNFSIPEIEAILAELDMIGDTAGDRFRIFFTTEETGLKEQLEVDFGDVLILKAFLQMVKSQMRQSDAYDLEVDDPNRIIAEIYGDSFSANDDLLIPYPDLLKVQPTAGQPGDGAAALAQARQDLLDSIDRFFEAVDYLRDEEDDQLDDLIYIDSRAEDKLERVEEKLADLQDSLVNDHAITHTTETTRNYLLLDYDQQNQINLSLVFDAFDNPDSDKGELAVIGNPTRWIIDSAEVDEWDLLIMVHGEDEGSFDAGILIGTINKEMNAITDAMFEYWGSQSDEIYGLNGQLTTTEKIEKQLDLNPIYGSLRYPEPVNPRDLLPEFDLWNGPQPGTVGHGLMAFKGLTNFTPGLPASGPATDGPAQLGGILPSVADQTEWIREINMQPGGRISLYLLSGETEQIELDGQLDEWHSEQLIFTDIADDTEEPNLVSGCDIENFYLTLSEDGSMLYGAITTHDIIDPGSADYKLRYKFFLSYIPRSRESLNSYSFIIKADQTTGIIYRYENSEWYGEWVEDGNFDVSVGQRSIEFAIPIDDPEIPLPGRFISLDSAVFDDNYETEETGEENNTHLQIASFGSENQLFDISGYVDYYNYQDGPIVVQAYSDYDDPDGSLIASLVLHNGPGPFVLEGIGQGWIGYVRAFAPVAGENYFGWEGDNDLISNIEFAEVIDSDFDFGEGEDLIINPWHDFCEYAVPLQVGVPFHGSAYNATGEDLTDNGASDKEDVWHSFTPEFDGVYRAQCTAEFYPSLSVFDGCGGDMLAFSSSENNEVYFNAIAGETYLIRISSEYYELGDYEITVYYYDVPLENDFCDQALPLLPDLYNPDMFTIAGDTLGATGINVTPQGYYDRCDVWNSFTPSQDGVYELTGQVSGNSTVAIYDACGGNLIAFQRTYYDINLRFYGVEGKTYLIRIAGEGNHPTTYDLTLAYGWAAPANDLCADANEIFLDDPLVGNTEPATGHDMSSCGDDDTRDLWYEFTPVSEALYQIDINLITAQATTISIFEKCGGEEILCRKDNYAYFIGQAGESYLIRVASTPQSSGEFVITVSQSANPSVPNDDWRNALPIEEYDHVESSTDGATGEDLTSCGVDDNLDVWYLFAPTRNGEFTVNFTSSTEGSIVAVFKYDWPLWLAGLGEVECLDENWDYTMRFEGRTDQLYLIRVAGQYNQYVNFSLSLYGPEVGWYTLSTDVVGNGTIQPSSGRYYEGEEVPLEAMPDEGWHFVEWQGDASGTDPNNQIVMDGNKEVTAVFEEDSIPPTFYDLSVNIIGQGSVDLNPAGGVYEEGMPVNLEAFAVEGWHFVEWQGDASGTNSVTQVVMDSDKHVTAVFERDQEYPTFYNLSVSTIGQGSVDLNPPGGVYESGMPVTLTAMAVQGWHFVQWQGAASGTNPVTQIVMDSNKSVTAVFEQDAVTQYELTVNIIGQGTVNLTPPGGIYDVDQQVSLSAAPAAGWYFVQWQGNAAGDNPNAQVTMNNNKTVTAVFAEIPKYELTVNVIGQGSVNLTPPGGIYEAGQVVTISATPAGNWHFVQWLGDAAGVNPVTQVVMDADKNINTEFEVDTGSVQVNIIPSPAIAAGAQWFMDGQSGNLHNSGEVLTSVSVGVHNIELTSCSGWAAPENITVQILAEQTTTVSATYVQTLPDKLPAGSLQVLLSSPNGPLDPAARWRILPDQTWYSSGHTVENLAPGLQTVTFNEVLGWIAPTAQSAQINIGATTKAIGVYTSPTAEIPQQGSLTVMIEPAAAAEQAYWRIDNGSWRSSGFTENLLPVGIHMVYFKPIATDEWITPDAALVNILPGESKNLYIEYLYIPDNSAEIQDMLFVSPSGSDQGGDGAYGKPFGTIQKAIDTTHNPGTVMVLPGIYTGSGNRDLDFMGKNITVRSSSGPEHCIIDCGGTEQDHHRGFYIHNGEIAQAIIEGFTITGGYANTGGGILCAGNSTPTIRNCIITGNTSQYSGAGLRCNFSSPDVANCIITKNTALMTGGGIFCYNGSQPKFANCSITENSAHGCGGGVYGYTDSIVEMTNCVIANNNSNSCGGGVYCAEQSQMMLTNCTIVSNAANIGGAIRCYDADVKVTSCIIWQNTSRESASPVDSFGSEPLFRYCDIESCQMSGPSWNSAIGTDGGGNLDLLPQFVELVEDANDYHLLNNSPCIDAGDPNAPCIEPQPNGSLVNMGAYGNTPQAALTVDSDSDGLLNPFEARWGLNCYSVDSDGDGLTDYQEVTLTGPVNLYDPYDANTGQGTSLNAAENDTDRDGLSDYQEVSYDSDSLTYLPYNPQLQTGTDLNALAFDSDGDLISDGWELRYPPALDPLDPTDALLDYDFDTFDNLTEYYSQSNPMDPASIPPAFAYEFEIIRLRQGNGDPLANGRLKFAVTAPTGKTITTIEFVWPDQDNIMLPTRSPAVYNQVDFFGSEEVILADIEAQFPAGMYSINLTFSDETQSTVVFEHWYSPYPEFPDVTYPTDDQSDVALEHVITWQDVPVTSLDILDTEDPLANLTFQPDNGTFAYQLPEGVLHTDGSYQFEFYNGGTLAPHLTSATLINCQTVEPAQIIYVDINAVGDNDGTSWANAYTSLAPALSSADLDAEIRVASGVYHPDEGLVFPVIIPFDVREISFDLPDGVVVKGGYAGTQAEPGNTRNVTEYPTVLSGALNAGVNSYHVVTAGNATLDGFIITAGQATGTDDSAFDNCGGGIFCDGTSPTISQCALIDNSANTGGAIYCRNGAQPTITRCLIKNNSARFKGGAVASTDSEPIIVNSLLTDNESAIGGAFHCDSGKMEIVNCTVAKNLAKLTGGGAFGRDTTILVTNSIFWGNTAKQGNQFSINSDTHLAVSYCDVQGGQCGVYRIEGSTLTWEPGNISSYPFFAVSGNYQLSSYSACINAGDNLAVSCCTTDLAGSPRIYNGGTVDIGCYEYQGEPALPDISAIAITSFTATASPNTNRGSIMVSGKTTDISPQIIKYAQTIQLKIGPREVEIQTDCDSVIKRGNNYIFKKIFANGGSCQLLFNTSNNTFFIKASNILLTGLIVPVTIEIAIDEYYRGQGQVDPSVIKKSIPLKFLSGHSDALRISKFNYRPGKTSAAGDSLDVIGEIALADNSTNLAQQDIIIRWGSFNVTIPAQNMHQRGTKDIFYFKSEPNSDLKVSTALFNLENCTFLIKIQHAAIGDQGEQAEFGLTFDSFDQSIPVGP